MKKFVVLLLGLVVGSIGCAIAQQPLETPDLVPPTPVALVATDHFPLSERPLTVLVVPARVELRPPRNLTARLRAWHVARRRLPTANTRMVLLWSAARI